MRLIVSFLAAVAAYAATTAGLGFAFGVVNPHAVLRARSGIDNLPSWFLVVSFLIGIYIAALTWKYVSNRLALKG